MQSYALAIGAFPIYLLAKRELRDKWYALAFSQLYLISPILWGVNQYEFHDLAFGVPFLLFAAYFYRAGKILPYMISLWLVLACSPFFTIIALVMAITIMIDSYFTPQRRVDPRFVVFTVVASLAFVLYLQTLPFLPSYNLSTVGTQSYTFFGSTAYVNPLIAIRDPIGSLSYDWLPKSLYVLSLLGSLFFLPVMSGRRFLPALPWLAVVIAYSPALGAGGVGPPYRFSQWSSFLIPFAFVGAIYGVKRLESSSIGKSRKMITRSLLVLMILTTATLAIVSSGLSPLSPSTQFSIGDSTVPTDLQPGLLFHGVWPTPVKDNGILDWFVEQVPANYSILTQNQIGSKLGERLAPVYIFYQPGYKQILADAILVDTNLDGLCTTCLDNLLMSGNYILHTSYMEGGIYLYYRVGL